MSRKIVVALGGNAILSSDPSAQAQQEALVETAKHLVKLIKNGDDLIITHGNGPQVGNLLLQHHSTQKKKQKQKLKNQEQLSKKMLVVAGVKLWLHQNQWISKKSIPFVLC